MISFPLHDLLYDRIIAASDAPVHAICGSLVNSQVGYKVLFLLEDGQPSIMSRSTSPAAWDPQEFAMKNFVFVRQISQYATLASARILFRYIVCNVRVQRGANGIQVWNDETLFVRELSPDLSPTAHAVYVFDKPFLRNSFRVSSGLTRTEDVLTQIYSMLI